MRRFWIYLFSALYALLLLVGCGKSDITRPEAKALLESNASFLQYKTKIPMHATALDLGSKMEWWQRRGMFIPTEFNSILKDEFVRMHGGNFERTYDMMELSKNASSSTVFDIEVTGISGDPKGDVRTIDFSWKYIALPQYVKFIAAEGGQGQAVARLYDDGWRISDGIVISPSQIPFALSKEEEAYKLTTISQLEEAKRNAIETRAREIANFNELVKKARTWSDIQQVLEFPAKSIWCCTVKAKVSINNGGITVEQFETRKNGEERNISTRSVYFSDIQRSQDSEPVVATVYDGVVNFGGIQIALQVSGEGAASNAHMTAVDEVNKTFSKWLRESDLEGRCPRSRKWGCDLLAG